MLIGAYLEGPGSRHATVARDAAKFLEEHDLRKRSGGAAAADTGKRRQSRRPVAISFRQSILFIAVLLNTVFMLIGNAIGRGSADFKRLWCGSMNIAVPTIGLSAVILGVIMMLRGADSFNTTLDTMRAIPSLGTFVSSTNAADRCISERHQHLFALGSFPECDDAARYGQSLQRSRVHDGRDRAVAGRGRACRMAGFCAFDRSCLVQVGTRWVAAAILLSGFAAPARAGAAPLNLQQSVQYALSHSPTIAAAGRDRFANAGGVRQGALGRASSRDRIAAKPDAEVRELTSVRSAP